MKRAVEKTCGFQPVSTLMQKGMPARLGVSTVPYTGYGRILMVSYRYRHTRTRICTVALRSVDGTVRGCIRPLTGYYGYITGASLSSSPSLSRAQCLNVRAPQYNIRLAPFALQEELQRLGELFLHVEVELFGACEGDEDVL
jgi:hypothetical protein